MERETWKPITGHESSYQVSNTGKVRSLTRSVTRANGRRQTVHARTLRPIRPGGYCQVQLWGEGAYESRYVHCLVMEEFVGPKPEGMEVNHIDGDLTNNAVRNLEYITHAENMRHAVHVIHTVTPPLNIHIQRKQNERATRRARPRNQGHLHQGIR